MVNAACKPSKTLRYCKILQSLRNNSYERLLDNFSQSNSSASEEHLERLPLYVLESRNQTRQNGFLAKGAKDSKRNNRRIAAFQTLMRCLLFIPATVQYYTSQPRYDDTIDECRNVRRHASACLDLAHDRLGIVQ